MPIEPTPEQRARAREIAQEWMLVALWRVPAGSNTLRITPGIMIEDDEATSGHTVSGSGVTMTVTTTNRIHGTNGMLIEQPTPANATMQYDTIYTGLGSQTPSTYFGVIAYWYEPLTPATISGVQMTLTSGAAGATTVSDPGKPYTGGCWVAFDVSEAVAFNAAPAGIPRLNRKVTQYSPYGSSVVFDTIHRNAKGKGSLIISFDDIHVTQNTTAFPLLEARGLNFCMYVPSAFVGAANRCTLVQLKAMYDSTSIRVDMCLDSTTNDASVNADPDIAWTGVNTIRSYLLANGMGRGMDHLCWANGQSYAAVADRLYAEGIKTMRHTSPGHEVTCKGIAAGDAKFRHSQGFSGAATTAASAKAGIDRAILTGTSYQLHMHDVAPSPSGIGITTAVLTEILDYAAAKVAAGELIVETPEQQWQRVGVCSYPMAA